MPTRTRRDWVAWLAGGVLSAVAAGASAAARDAFLDRLAGHWLMKGTVGHTAVSYDAEGRWMLADGWLRLSLIDAAKPTAYEADVYLGFDPKAGDYVVHWLDRFGAAGARVVGMGLRHERTLVFEFPYAESTFRDTLTLAEDGEAGVLLIESIDPAGHVSTFASYTFTRRP